MTDRQPWDDVRDKQRAESQVLKAAIKDVVDYLTGPAEDGMHPGNYRDLLGDLAYRLRRFTNDGNGRYLPMKQRLWIVQRLTNATACLPWKDE